MNELIRKIDVKNIKEKNINRILSREWLFTNGLGGYASGTISGIPTRRYHSLLTAALPTPLGRIVMLSHIAETISLPDGKKINLGNEERTENILDIYEHGYLSEFLLEYGIPIWRYEINNTIIEKQLLLPYKQNTVLIIYRILKGDDPVRIELYPSMQFRPHEAPVSTKTNYPYLLTICGDRYELVGESGIPALHFYIYGEDSAMTSTGGNTRELFYRLEAERGYDSRGLLWTPGYFRAYLNKNKNVTLAASTESWETILALNPEEAHTSELSRRKRLISAAHPNARKGTAAELILAADQFIITPAGRIEDSARARAAGDEVRTIIAGYHWFTDWGRDTMISLEGLTLATGRYTEAGWILRTFAHYIKDGLIPNLFPEGKKEGLYHTADATLWFFHAVNKYLEVTNDKITLETIIPKLVEIVNFHLRGTRFGIQVDPEDGLLKQGKEGYQLTWMDAKVDDWVVTPRRGKAVEINALWYNALCLLDGWIKETGFNNEVPDLTGCAEKARESFNKKFWYQEGEYLYDIVEGENGNDNAFRPNQVMAISLENPILERDKWEPLLKLIKQKLVTPVGLRSLAPGNPDYKSKYFGDLRARDAAYHQGTVWAWLIGPFVDAWQKTFPDDKENLKIFLSGFASHLSEACIGNISEIFDADSPFLPRGCIAQAWSVAEVLRSFIKLEQD